MASYLIVLLIFYFQHNHCISQKYQRYLICRLKSIIEGAESIKLMRLENEQKKEQPALLQAVLEIQERLGVLAARCASCVSMTNF